MAKMLEINFQLCEEADQPTNKPDRIAQFKFDGRRVAVLKKGNEVQLWGRDVINAHSFPEIVDAFKKIPGNFIVDTEFAVFTDEMKTDRGLLQSRDKTKDAFKIRLLSNLHPATAIVFDLLEFNGQDLRNEEYQKRREVINEHFKQFVNPQLKVAEDMKPDEAWQLAIEKQLEGIVEKDIRSKYIGKRDKSWTKIKRKEISEITFTGYEISPVGLTLTNKQGFRVACNGEQHKKVKEIIDKQGFALVRVRGMAGKTVNGKIREIVFHEMIG